MKIGDKLKCIDPSYVDFLSKSPTLTVSAILDHDGTGYNIHLEEFGDFIFPEDSFTILPEEAEQHLELSFTDPKSPKDHVIDELNKWRDRFVQAENEEDAHETGRCRKFLDFFLDKLLTIEAYEKETAEETPVLAD